MPMYVYLHPPMHAYIRTYIRKHMHKHISTFIHSLIHCNPPSPLPPCLPSSIHPSVQPCIHPIHSSIHYSSTWNAKTPLLCSDASGWRLPLLHHSRSPKSLSLCPSLAASPAKLPSTWVSQAGACTVVTLPSCFVSSFTWDSVTGCPTGRLAWSGVYVKGSACCNAVLC